MSKEQATTSVPRLIHLDNGDKIRADMIFAIRPLDASDGGDGKPIPPRVVVEYGRKPDNEMRGFVNSTILKFDTFHNAQVMATRIAGEVKRALADD